MFLIVRQNHDLTEVSGYPFATVAAARTSAELEIGRSLEATAGAVKVTDGPDIPCFAVRPHGAPFGSPFFREGQLTLIVDVDHAAAAAVRLCRRNQSAYAAGHFVLIP